MSHVLIGLSALTYTFAIFVIKDGAVNIAMVGKMGSDPLLKDKGTAQRRFTRL